MSVSVPHWPRRGLYAITPDGLQTPQLVRVAESALRGGAVLLQYRNKLADAATRNEQARALRPLCECFGVALVVNDDPALAHSISAGAHVGEHDAGLAEARNLLGPNAIIGASCYDDIARAERAAEAGASYLAFGAFYPSATKPNARRAALSLLRDSARFGLPRVAIGGITVDNARPLIEAGADLIAVVSAVFDAADIEAAARQFATLFQD